VPTAAEIEGLVEATHSWGELNGIAGCYVGNEEPTLFLPAAGYRSYNNGTLYYVGTTGNYWSSGVSGTNATYLNFNSGNFGTGSNYRAFGFSLRCVAE
jgi:hypothetical protein